MFTNYKHLHFHRLTFQHMPKYKVSLLIVLKTRSQPPFIWGEGGRRRRGQIMDFPTHPQTHATYLIMEKQNTSWSFYFSVTGWLPGKTQNHLLNSLGKRFFFLINCWSLLEARHKNNRLVVVNSDTGASTALQLPLILSAAPAGALTPGTSSKEC